MSLILPSENVVDTGNSISAVLTPGQVVTGTIVDLLKYVGWGAETKAEQDGTVDIFYYHDAAGTILHKQDTFPINETLFPGRRISAPSIPKEARFLRVQYTQGSVSGRVDLHVTLLTEAAAVVQFSLSTKPFPTTVATFTRAVLTGEIPAVGATAARFEYVPLTPSKMLAIANLHQFLAEQGKTYQVTSDIIIPRVITEFDFMLLKNPSGSTVNVKVRKVRFGVEKIGDRAALRVYRNPTITANGTALSIQNEKFDGAAGQATAFKSPTISVRGGLMANYISEDVFSEEYDSAIILTPNTNLLITVVPSKATDAMFFGIEFSEQAP